MRNIKMIVADYDLVVSSNRDENEDKAYTIASKKGIDNPQLCGCCGKIIKDIDTAKSLRIIGGGKYYTEYDGEDVPSDDMGWWYVGSVCYKKFLRNKKEADVEVED